MKRIFSLFFWLMFYIYSFAQLPTTSQNYIVEKTFRREYKSTANITGKPVDSINVNIQYFDGLGRPLQTVQWQGSPTKKDIVQHVEYDEFGRESKKYLPYAEQSTNNGSYKTAAKTNQGNFYKVGGGWDANVMKTNSPYAVTVFENSPLNRVLEQGAPGDAWQPATSRTTTGRTVVTEYGTNVATGTEAVKLWKINTNNVGATGSTNYAAGKLYKSTIKDENWVSGKSGTVEEYKDFEDRVILKRVWESETKKLETYYVYDDFGDLRFVIPPGFTSSSITENDPVFNELIYAYKYDGRRRLIEKKIPGKGWEWIVYNVNDQVVLTQDAVQRAKTSKEWSYTKYDAFGRVIETGLYSDATLITQAIAQNTVNAVTQYWETRGQNSTYSNVAFPTITTTAKKPLVINYYDDYTFDGGTTASLQAVGITKSTKTKTLLTGTKVFKDDGTLPLLTINYYDDRARLIQSAGQNHLGGTDYVTNTYSFVGELLTSKREHKASASGAVTTLFTKNEYDHVGRLKDVKHKVNAQDTVILARHEYNEIGQLKTKRQHLEKNQTVFINTTTYSYNERGWTTKATSPHFTYQLNYNTGSSPQYNGNIAQQLWGHGSTNTPNVYSYSYDKLNRLLNGTSTGTVMSEVLTYDDMGNIKTLKRDNGTTTTYNYTVNSVASNRLQSLTGGLTGTYTYDANGNATKDRTDMTFAYNHLNLPKSATKSGTTVTYLYDAVGTKLRKTAVVGATTTVRDYVGGIIEYNKVGTGAQTIEMIHMPEGYLQPNGSTYTYYYNLTDHLGNVRATLQRTSATAGTVIQKHDYYPFGKSKALQLSGINKYLYNGKEVQSELGDQQDYGARFYDAEIGRWNVVDPLAEQMRRHSPYSYAFGNPIRFIDPDGMAPMAFDNEYEVIYQGGKIESVRYVSDKGGDKTDYITVIDLDKAPLKEGITQYEMDVDVEYTSGVGTNYTQQESPTPGERKIHGSTPLEFSAIETLAALYTGGATIEAKYILKQTVKEGVKRKASASIRKAWEKSEGTSWPKEPDVLPDGRTNKYAGRNQSVSHRKALKDGGTNDLDNIFPQPWILHQEMHKIRGDFKRWAKEQSKKK
jgi:RHS repeat-associated protein